MNTRVKICGITRSEDALTAVDAGASAIGFIFARSSPRYVSPDKARTIIRGVPPFVTPVGVFTETTRPEALAMVAKSGIRSVQLHGENDLREFEDFPVPVYRVFLVSAEFNVETLRGYRGSAFMLDTFKEGVPGGTGERFDWTVAAESKKYGRLILSGGINPGNIAEALRRVAPFAIDVNSGVESSPGIKDPDKIRLLFHALRDAEMSLQR